MPASGRLGDHFKACAELPGVRSGRDLRPVWPVRPAQLLDPAPASH